MCDDEECTGAQANCHMANIAVDHEDFKVENYVILTTSTVNKGNLYNKTNHVYNVKKSGRFKCRYCGTEYDNV